MRNLSGLATLTLVSALAVACFSAPASAALQKRSFYQNSSASCHGATLADEENLQRTEQSLRNISAFDVTVVCSLQTDLFAQITPNNETVDYVAIWAKRSASAPALKSRGRRSVAQSRGRAPANNGVIDPNDSLSCTMRTSYADDPDGQTISRSVNALPVSPSTSQAVLEWIPAEMVPAQTKILAPVNLNCILHPHVELNDWIVVFTVDVGA